MKVSTEYNTSGLVATIRSLQSGQTIHARFVRGQTTVPVEIQLGAHRIETQLTLHLVGNPRDSELDMCLTLTTPGNAPVVRPSVDYVPALVPPAPGGKIDVDGYPMNDSVAIADEPPLTKTYVKDVRKPMVGIDYQPETHELKQGEILDVDGHPNSNDELVDAIAKVPQAVLPSESVFDQMTPVEMEARSNMTASPLDYREPPPDHEVEEGELLEDSAESKPMVSGKTGRGGKRSTRRVTT